MLNELTQRFVLEYLKDFNGRAAARRSGFAGTDTSQASQVTKLLKNPEVQEALAAAKVLRAERLKIDAAKVLEEIAGIATADPNQLVEIRRGCCRYCWGTDFQFQFRSERELKLAERAFGRTIESLVEDFEHGGLGFDSTRLPNSDCPECSGEGTPSVFVRDTRHLPSQALSLYAGARQTKDGIEVKLHDKAKNLELLARHLGLLNDRLEVTGSAAIAERLLAARKRKQGAA